MPLLPCILHGMLLPEVIVGQGKLDVPIVLGGKQERVGRRTKGAKRKLLLLMLLLLLVVVIEVQIGDGLVDLGVV